MPATPFLLSVAGLGVSLAGFAALVAALRRGAEWKPLDVYRLRQIPEMGLSTSLLSLASIALADTVRPSPTAVRIAAGIATAFVIFHVVMLWLRARAMGIKLTSTNFWMAGALDIAAIVTGSTGIAFASTATFEWVLILLLARAVLAFLLVLGDLPSSR